MPVETGESFSSQDNSPRIKTPSQAKKRIFANGLFCADFPALRVGLLCNQQEKSMQNSSLIHATGYAGRGRTKHVSACLPFISDVRNGTSFAPWPVCSGSTTKDARFVPLPRKAAMKIYHKAVQWNRRDKLAGTHGGVIGSHVLLVLHTLIFEFLNQKTGRLDPSYSSLQKATRLCRQTVAVALARLKELGIINWIRRCIEDRDADGRFVLRQQTNAYAILPPSQWRDYMDVEIPEPPHPATWGACPPLPSLVEQAATAAQEGDSMASIVRRLENDPRDTLASALSSLGRSLGIN